MANKANSLAHTKWMCKYHIIFTPKYRRKVIYNQYRKDLGKILRELCRYKHVEMIEGYLKGKVILMMFERYVNTGSNYLMYYNNKNNSIKHIQHFKTIKINECALNKVY